MTASVTDYSGGLAGIKAAEARRLEMLKSVEAAIDQFGRLSQEVGIGLDQMPAEMETARRALWMAHARLEAMKQKAPQSQFIADKAIDGYCVVLQRDSTAGCQLVPIAHFVGPSAESQAWNLRDALNRAVETHVEAYEGAIRL